MDHVMKVLFSRSQLAMGADGFAALQALDTLAGCYFFA